MGLKAVASNTNTGGTSLTTLAQVSGAAFINGLGDSITSCGSIYQPSATPSSLVPAWAASTAYSTNQYVQNGGNLYLCTSGGTSASSGGPTGVGASITDNGAHWSYTPPLINKNNCSYLWWAEKSSLGRLVWDMSQGYSGPQGCLLKVLVINGGSNYTAPTLTLNNGATGTLQVAGGVITGVTLTNPGYAGITPGSAFTYSVSDSTGSGAVLSLASYPSGTFGVPNCGTADMVARLPDVVACAADIIVVHGGTNDFVTYGLTYAQTTANLKTCYETLMAAGKKVIAIPIMPRTSATTPRYAVQQRVNNWIRAYCRKESWANPSGYTNIALADPMRYVTDGTNTGSIYPIGGSAAAAGAMTQDGVHPSPRMAFYMGYEIWQAAQRWVSPTSFTAPRSASMIDGYDPTVNPGGNAFEGFPWQASTAYALGALCSNNSNVYCCTGAGTSAGSGGPSGTGGSISDGSATWTYERAAGASVFASGTGGTFSGASGITESGSIATGYVFQRLSGSSSGTVTAAIENPWSDGQVGQRQSLTFSLGSGATNETWFIYLNSLVTSNYGIQSSDLGNAGSLFFVEAEVDLSGIANLQGIYLAITDGNQNTFSTRDGVGPSSTALTMPNSSSEMLSYPGSGRFYFKTQPAVLPANLASDKIVPELVFIFNASGGAGSATLTAKINYMGLRRALVA